MNHRVGCLPVPFVIDPQSLKKFLFPAKQLFNGIYKQALAKASGPAEKIVFTGFHELMDDLCFININITTFPDFKEALQADRVFTYHRTKIRRFCLFCETSIAQMRILNRLSINPIEKLCAKNHCLFMATFDFLKRKFCGLRSM